MSDVVMHKAGIDEDGDACYWVDKEFCADDMPVD